MFCLCFFIIYLLHFIDMWYRCFVFLFHFSFLIKYVETFWWPCGQLILITININAKISSTVLCFSYLKCNRRLTTVCIHTIFKGSRTEDRSLSSIRFDRNVYNEKYFSVLCIHIKRKKKKEIFFVLLIIRWPIHQFEKCYAVRWKETANGFVWCIFVVELRDWL